MAVVQNTSGVTLRLIRVGQLHPIKINGVNLELADNATGTVPDDFLQTEGAIALRNAGNLTVISFDDSIGSAVVQGETTLSAAYTISLSNTPADFGGQHVAASAQSVIAENYDFSNPANRTLNITINGVAIVHTFVSGDFSDQAAGTAAEVATSLVGNTAFAAQAVAADAAGDVLITSLALGTSSTIAAISGTADTILDLAGGITSPGTLAPSLAEVTVLDSRGNVAAGVDVTAEIFDAITAGALLAATAVQVAAKGTFQSGQYTNSGVIRTDGGGEADFEVVSDISGVDSLFLDLAAPAGFFLSVTDRKGSDSSRETIAKTS